MPVKSTVLGPGILEFGETGSLKDFSCQVTSVTVGMEPDRDDPTPTLCGDSLVGEATYNAELEATLVQDLEESGIVKWSWDHRGETVPVRYVPNRAAGLEVTGRVIIDPISIGGDVKVRNTSDITYSFVGEPDLNYPDSIEGGAGPDGQRGTDDDTVTL